MKETKRVMKEMMTGMAVWGILVLIILEIISTHRLAMAAGVLLGAATAVGLMFHMYRHLDIALDLDAAGARRHTQFAAIKRLGIMAVVLVLSMTQYRYVHPVGTVLGIFGLKISALMQPLVHKIMSKKKRSS